MKKVLACSIYSVFVVVATGCAATDKTEIQTQNCSMSWYEDVEKKILTGDGQGHGPDLGSIEWRSVIEFKLDLRENSDVPDLKSEQWCNYINEHFIENDA